MRKIFRKKKHYFTDGHATVYGPFSIKKIALYKARKELLNDLKGHMELTREDIARARVEKDRVDYLENLAILTIHYDLLLACKGRSEHDFDGIQLVLDYYGYKLWSMYK